MIRRLWMSLVSLIQREPARVTGVLVGGVVYLLVHFLHVDASQAQQAAIAIVPLIVSEIIRGKVTPVQAQTGLEDVLMKLQSLATTVEMVEGKTAIGEQVARGINDLLSLLQSGIVPLPGASPVAPILPSDGTPPWLAATEAVLLPAGPAVSEPAGPALQE